MKKNILFAICLLVVSMAFVGCNPFGKSAVVGEWKDEESSDLLTTIWTFYSDGSYSEKMIDIFDKERSAYGRYHVKGKKLILHSNSNTGGDYIFTWRKSDSDHLIIGNDAGGYWKLKRVR